MTGTSLSPTLLPKALALTEALAAPATVEIEPSDSAHIRQVLDDVAKMIPLQVRVQVDGYFLRTALTDPEKLGKDDQFSWSSLTATRRIGVAAVRSCLRRLHRTPAEAAGAVIKDAIEDAEQGRERAGSLASWLRDLPIGGRSVVEADAVNWATHLLCSLDWRTLDCTPVIGRDQWWEPSSSASLVLRGRAEVRTALKPISSVSGSSIQHIGLFTMISGRPNAVSATELGLSALVTLLAHPANQSPERVVGWWPQCGRAMVVISDGEALKSTAEAVAEAIAVAAKVKGWTRRES